MSYPTLPQTGRRFCKRERVNWFSYPFEDRHHTSKYDKNCRNGISLRIYFWWCNHTVPGQEPEQQETIGVGPCPRSGAVWKVLHKAIQPIHPCLSPGPCSGPGDNQCDQIITQGVANIKEILPSIYITLACERTASGRITCHQQVAVYSMQAAGWATIRYFLRLAPLLQVCYVFVRPRVLARPATWGPGPSRARSSRLYVSVYLGEGGRFLRMASLRCGPHWPEHNWNRKVYNKSSSITGTFPDTKFAKAKMLSQYP